MYPHIPTQLLPGASRGKTALLAGIFLLVQPLPHLCQAEEIAATRIDDQRIAAFFQSLEESFRNKRAPDVIARLHKKFSYIMTYCTDDAFSVVENNLETYRASVGSFFMRDPEVLEFTIAVQQVEPLGEKIAVVARINSTILLNGILNTCETFSNYNLLQYEDRLLIKDIRGDASCTNSKAEGKAQQ